MPENQFCAIDSARNTTVKLAGRIKNNQTDGGEESGIQDSHILDCCVRKTVQESTWTGETEVPGLEKEYQLGGATV
jgi:hypothetical protein